MGEPTLVLTRRDVLRLLTLEDCIDRVEAAFRVHGEGRASDPAIAGVHVPAGGFHVKAGVLDLGRPYFVAKTNANFMDNRSRFGLPTIQGTIVVHDVDNGRLLAVMDSIEISILRTGAATAVAARYLARPESSVAVVAGCGEQGRVQLRALAEVLPLRKAWVWDVDPQRAEGMASELTSVLGIDVTATDNLRRRAREADVGVTCTPSADFLLGRGDVGPGMFIAGVGTDAPHKKELAPDLLAKSKVVVDVIGQCAEIGDLHHALESAVMTRDDVHAELGAVVAGRAAGRTEDEEITVFDSTGMALQDAAAAALVYERALAERVGRPVDFAA